MNIQVEMFFNDVNHEFPQDKQYKMKKYASESVLTISIDEFYRGVYGVDMGKKKMRDENFLSVAPRNKLVGKRSGAAKKLWVLELSHGRITGTIPEPEPRNYTRG